MARLVLSFLGSFRIDLDGHNIESMEADKGRALLAYLAVEADHPHTREKLAGIFWPEQDEEHARGSLSQSLYHLRGTLGDRPATGVLPGQPLIQARPPFLLVTTQDVQLNPQASITTDIADFRALLDACKTHTHPVNELCDECLERYRVAARLYRGDFLCDFYLSKGLAFEEWATVLREQLHLEILGVLEHLVLACERRGELEQALSYARKMIHLDDLSEAGTQHLLRLLGLLDRPTEALLHYDEFTRQLAVQLGSEPATDTKALYRQLKCEIAGTSSGIIPASLSPFIGRQKELDELWGMLRDPQRRLISILGIGGCGKTRLAIEAARRQRYYFRDGVYYISLSALGKGSSLLAAIADGLDFSFRELGDPKKQLLDYLHNKRMLLILDSFETVVETARLVAEILAASPGVKVLSTSRVRLNINGENTYMLAGMRVPPAESGPQDQLYSAVVLFLEAARRMAPGYKPAQMEDVNQLCRLVEGMPLSLLLASAWVNDYSLREISTQIKESLDFLAVEWADMPERQRSLRATFEYSWNLMTTGEQQALMKLAMFRNHFTTQAAEWVAGVGSRLLHELAGKSLLSSSPDGYYQMHDLVRQYSAEKLSMDAAEEASVAQRYIQYFLGMVTGWSKSFKSPDQSTILAVADRVVDDIHVAWQLAVGRADVQRLSQSMEGLLLYYSLRYRLQEGEQACQVALDRLQKIAVESKCEALCGHLLAWRAVFYRLLGKVDAARRSLEESSSVLKQAGAAGQDVQPAKALFWRERQYYAFELQEKLDYLNKSAAIYQQLGDAWSQAWVLGWAGEYANRLGNYALAQDLHQQAVELSRTTGDPRRLADSLKFLGYDHLINGPWQTGFSYMEEASSYYRSVGDLSSLAYGEILQGTSLGWIGRFQEGCEVLEQALLMLNQLGDRYYIAYASIGLGTALMWTQRYTQAATTLHKCLEATRQDGFQREEASCLAILGCLEIIQGNPSGALSDFQESVAKFRRMGFAGELSMALSGLALVEHLLGHVQVAKVFMKEAIQIAVKSHSRFTLFILPASLIVILADNGYWEQAVEAHASLMNDPVVSNSRWIADMIGNRMDLARENLPEDVFQAAEARGRESDLFEVFGRLANEMGAELALSTTQE